MKVFVFFVLVAVAAVSAKPGFNQFQNQQMNDSPQLSPQMERAIQIATNEFVQTFKRVLIEMASNSKRGWDFPIPPFVGRIG